MFFIQTILAGRHIHRKELRLVSLERPSSVEYRIENVFSIFFFYRELSRFKVFTFSAIFDRIFVNFCNSFKNNDFGLTFKDRDDSPICFIRDFCLILQLNSSNLILFQIKKRLQIRFYILLSLNLQ